MRWTSRDRYLLAGLAGALLLGGCTAAGQQRAADSVRAVTQSGAHLAGEYGGILAAGVNTALGEEQPEIEGGDTVTAETQDSPANATNTKVAGDGNITIVFVGENPQPEITLPDRIYPPAAPAAAEPSTSPEVDDGPSRPGPAIAAVEQPALAGEFVGPPAPPARPARPAWCPARLTAAECADIDHIIRTIGQCPGSLTAEECALHPSIDVGPPAPAAPVEPSLPPLMPPLGAPISEK